MGTARLLRSRVPAPSASQACNTLSETRAEAANSRICCCMCAISEPSCATRTGCPMSKSLLLGSAAGLVAVGGAQAADLPVKAKPVEYVKICSIYGAGFFYIPGTDTCIKIGGWVRAEYAFQTGNSSIAVPARAAAAVTTASTRTSTTCGLAGSRRSTCAPRPSTEPCAPTAAPASRRRLAKPRKASIYTERGFIQFAGFTFGKSQSYFDFFGGAFCYGCSTRAARR